MKVNITIFFVFMSIVFSQAQTTFIVNTIDDTDDIDINNTICADVNGNCSLRAAIRNANKTSNKDTIIFDLTGTAPFVLSISLDVLPPIQQPAIIDGRTQPGYTNAPLIEIDGVLLGPGYQGIQFTGNANGSEMYGLSIGGFQEQDVSPFNFGFGVFINAVSNLIFQGNYIGLRSDGNTLFTNTGGGIFFNNSSNNLIGGTNPNDANLISGNYSGGLTFQGGTNNLVQGNLIGTDITGTLNRGNRFNVQLLNSSNNTIGGATPEQRNIISGGKNDQDATVDGTGFSIFGSASTGNRILGNYIGTDITGTQSIPNVRGGVLLLFGANNNEIGGINTGDGNVISGNGFYGVYLQGSEASPVSENFIQGNKIGIDATGSSALPNQVGIMMLSGVNNNNFIGGLIPNARNIVSGNSNAGIAIVSGQNNSIIGNFVGTNIDGNVAVPNNLGISIQDSNNIVGVPESGNLISGNTTYGLNIEGNAIGTLIQGNFIGTNVTGNSSIPNINTGLFINASSGPITVGGSETARNIISGNQVGITIQGTGHDISFNYIGLDATGTTSLPNQIGAQASGNLTGTEIHHNTISGNGLTAGTSRNLSLNGASNLKISSNILGLQSNGINTVSGINNTGIILQNSSNNIIGGITLDEGNVISGNGLNGIVMIFNSESNLIQNNLIGLAADGTTVIGNASNGISISGTITSGLIEDNIIAGNNGYGVFLDTSAGIPTGITISENSIYDNTTKGIGLIGVGANDPGDADSGANNRQNNPEISTVINLGNGDFEITYSVSSAVENSTYPLTIEFFGAINGQGKFYFGTDIYNAPGSKTVVLSLPNGYDETDYQYVVGTATDADGNTSEFSIEATLSTSTFENHLVSIFPNPAKDLITLNLRIDTVYTVRIFNLNGQLINSFPNLSGIKKLSIDSLKSGVYLINIKEAAGQEQQLKLIKI